MPGFRRSLRKEELNHEDHCFQEYRGGFALEHRISPILFQPLHFWKWLGRSIRSRWSSLVTYLYLGGCRLGDIRSLLRVVLDFFIFAASATTEIEQEALGDP